MSQRYYLEYSLKNGLGHPAVSLFLTGCDNPIKCKGCHNYELQKEDDSEIDIKIIRKQMDKMIKWASLHSNPLYFCFLGGEPLAKYNRDMVKHISTYITSHYPNIIQVVYTWRKLQNIKKECLDTYIKYIDYGILGIFDEDLKVDNMLPSSTNQYIYDFKNDKKINSIKLKKEGESYEI